MLEMPKRIGALFGRACVRWCAAAGVAEGAWSCTPRVASAVAPVAELLRATSSGRSVSRRRNIRNKTAVHRCVHAAS